MEQIMQYDASDNPQTLIVDVDGMVMVSGDSDAMGKHVEYSDLLKGKNGTFTRDGSMYLYQKVTGWNYYVISSVPTIELYKGSIRTIFVTGFIVGFMILVSIIMVRIVIQKCIVH